ncbi:MAG: ATP-dependent RecD-like DNA helicase [Clostridia bacterium]
MEIQGVVSDIIFYNQQNGYSVISVKASDKEYTCVGNLPVISKGEQLVLSGYLTTHSQYGEQFVVQNFTIRAPQSQEGIIKYLSSGLIKGIGEATAKKIYDAFGVNTLEIIEKEPALLANIKGISVNKANDIASSYKSIVTMQQQIMFLQQYNITINTAVKIYNVYQDATKSVVSQNPYKLIDDIDGIGFISADRIAHNMGIDYDSPFRLRAGIIYCLKESAEKLGNTFISKDDLTSKVSNLLELDLLDKYASVYDEIIGRLTLDVTIRVFDIGLTSCVSLSKYYNMEKAISAKLIQIKNQSIDVQGDFSSLIAEFERINNIKLHNSQKEAIISSLTNGVTVITGGPGTGKTTIIKCITHIYSTFGKKIELTSPTGRASKRLALSTGKEAKTIHRLLGAGYSNGKMGFLYDQYNPLQADVVIVDEVSMVDVSIAYSLFKALDSSTRLILVGDKDQLPSVGAGNVLSNIISSGVIDVKYLTHIYRQEQDSLIISNAHLINNCKMPICNNASKDFFIISKNSQDEVFEECMQLISKRLPTYKGVEGGEIQLLGALKSGVAGVDNSNKSLQRLLNPASTSKQEIKLGDTTFRVGDRVMQTVNDYSLDWYKSGIFGSIEYGQGVFNGDIGVINSVNKSSNTLEILFDDGRTAQYNNVDLYNLSLAYAMTIHKSQGSEFDCVVIPLVSGPPTILNKNLLYTAVTRAKKVVVLVCNKKILSMVVHNNYISERTTLLDKFLNEDFKRYEGIV